MPANYDAIVIDSGISGGWAAKEFCDHGLKTLMIERGRNVVHLKDYLTATMNPWDFTHREQLTLAITEKNPIVNKCYAFNETCQQFFVKDYEHPYVQEKPFDCIRGYQVGGKSLLWATQTQRWSKYDFEGPGRDGFAGEWPLVMSVGYDDNDLKSMKDYLEQTSEMLSKGGCKIMTAADSKQAPGLEPWFQQALKTRP